MKKEKKKKTKAFGVFGQNTFQVFLPTDVKKQRKTYFVFSVLPKMLINNVGP